jgi:hypothetical protein
MSGLSFLDKHACGVRCAVGIHRRDRRFPPLRTSRRFVRFPVRALGALPAALSTGGIAASRPTCLKNWDADVFERLLILAWLLP